jgi:quinoprotein glucose dehydrogenase
LNSEAAKKEWRVYLGDQASSYYSALNQINQGNVRNLQAVWRYHTGDLPAGEYGEIQCNPIVVNGVLYGSSPRTKIFALNAGTGEEIWKFDPFAEHPEESNTQGRHRGVTYWQDESGKDKRILFTAGAHMFAVDAMTGKLIATFGDSGKVRLDKGLDRELGGDGGWDLFVSATTPGVIYRDLLILGTRVSEGPISAPGHIRAFDARTGAVKWIFHTIPHPGEFGYDTWPPEAWKKAGGANCWAGMSVDLKRGLVFIPTGSAAYDFYGGNRTGQNLFANCLLALKAETGERVWHYQTVHHDLWDRDLPAPPNLVTIERDGKKIDAVAQVTKSGFVFMFNRETGEPLFPIEEKSYPASDLPGEATWPTPAVAAQTAGLRAANFHGRRRCQYYPGSA